MSTEELGVALAARAAGEDLPNGDPAALERLLRDDAALRDESERLVQAVAVLRSAAVAPDAGRRRAAIDRARERSTRRPWRWVTAAAVLLVAVGVAVRLRREPPPLGVPDAVAQRSPFEEAFAEALRRPQGDVAPAPPGAAAADPDTRVPVRGAEKPLAGFLRPFAAQADFRIVAPEALPPGASLVAAKFRRKADGVRPFSFAWLEWTTPKGAILLIQAPAGSAVDDAFEQLPLLQGWQVLTFDDLDGVATIIASPLTALSNEQLDAIVESLAPIDRR